MGGSQKILQLAEEGVRLPEDLESEAQGGGKALDECAVSQCLSKSVPP